MSVKRLTVPPSAVRRSSTRSTLPSTSVSSQGPFAARSRFTARFVDRCRGPVGEPRSRRHRRRPARVGLAIAGAGQDDPLVAVEQHKPARDRIDRLPKPRAFVLCGRFRLPGRPVEALGRQDPAAQPGPPGGRRRPTPGPGRPFKRGTVSAAGSSDGHDAAPFIFRICPPFSDSRRASCARRAACVRFFAPSLRQMPRIWSLIVTS